MKEFNLKRATELAGLLGIEPTPPEDECVRVYSSEPIPDFWKRLPDELPGGVMMSQSFMKAFLKVIDRDLCGLRFYRTRVTRECEETTGHAATMGHRFEYLVTGEQPAYGGDASEPFLTSRGTPTADEKRIQADAEVARGVLAEFTAGYAFAEAGPQVAFKCLRATFDVLCYPIETPEISQLGRVIDLKYSGLLNDKWSKFGWVNVAENEHHLIQAKHYTLLAERYFGTAVDFVFLVFSSKPDKINGVEQAGEYKPIRVRVGEKAMNEHKHLILTLIEQYTRMHEGKEFTARPSYSGCRDCPVANCKKRATNPEIEEIQL